MGVKCLILAEIAREVWLSFTYVDNGLPVGVPKIALEAVD